VYHKSPLLIHGMLCAVVMLLNRDIFSTKRDCTWVPAEISCVVLITAAATVPFRGQPEAARETPSVHPSACVSCNDGFNRVITTGKTTFYS
jgi:hypothetical protein